VPALLNAEVYEELAVQVPSQVQHLADDRLRAARVEVWLKRADGETAYPRRLLWPLLRALRQPG